MKDRDAYEPNALVGDSESETFNKFLVDNADREASVYEDEMSAGASTSYDHRTVDNWRSRNSTACTVQTKSDLRFLKHSYHGP